MPTTDQTNCIKYIKDYETRRPHEGLSILDKYDHVTAVLMTGYRDFKCDSSHPNDICNIFNIDENVDEVIKNFYFCLNERLDQYKLQPFWPLDDLENDIQTTELYYLKSG